MNVVIFGATGMVGQGVLRECLLDSGIKKVLVIGRQPTGVANGKLLELIHKDFGDFSAISSELRDLDACFFCLGVSALGMTEADYRRITYDVTLAAAQTLLAASPGITFEYISGRSTDSSGKGRMMWARVKGETENALLRMPFKAAYMLRPGIIIPLNGIRSKTPVYRFLYALVRPLAPLLEWSIPSLITDTQRLGQFMIRVARTGAPKRVLEMSDISQL